MIDRERNAPSREVVVRVLRAEGVQVDLLESGKYRLEKGDVIEVTEIHVTMPKSAIRRLCYLFEIEDGRFYLS